MKLSRIFFSNDIPQLCTHATDQLAANGVLLNHGWEKRITKGAKVVV